MKVTEIYETLQAAGLVSSQLQFSSIWLGRSPRYYSHLLASQREPGLATLNGVWWRLNSFKSTESANAHRLEGLKLEIAAYISRRAITDRQKDANRTAD